MKRIRLTRVQLGTLEVSAAEMHHARDVLRLEAGTEVEVFDAEGRVGRAVLTATGVSVTSVMEAQVSFRLTVAAAVPKGNRADWMIEKLSELGVSRFVPLAAERSVVLPDGVSKYQRWQRLADESAKQSHRRGVMKIGQLVNAQAFAAKVAGPGWYFSTRPGARTVQEALGPGVAELTVLVGPEGGWTEGEMQAFETAGLVGVTLGETVLRIETAAVAGAAVVSALTACPRHP